MEAVILHSYGDPSQLSYETDEDLPEVAEGEVRVRLRATSMNPIDWNSARVRTRIAIRSTCRRSWAGTWPARWTRSGRAWRVWKKACA